GMVILECRAAVTDGTWRLKGIFQGRLAMRRGDESGLLTGSAPALSTSLGSWASPSACVQSRLLAN
ncbi:hypothetical protein, partial [Xanthomonas fragariae]|uniref:hypothetical protein n=1 Tax=Xanthomonas fragariae TaxID=48664 RepID=UPI0025A0EFF1